MPIAQVKQVQLPYILLMQLFPNHTQIHLITHTNNTANGGKKKLNGDPNLYTPNYEIVPSDLHVRAPVSSLPPRPSKTSCMKPRWVCNPKLRILQAIEKQEGSAQQRDDTLAYLLSQFLPLQFALPQVSECLLVQHVGSFTVQLLHFQLTVQLRDPTIRGQLQLMEPKK